jgi:uncharacterized membrane protein YeiH
VLLRRELYVTAAILAASFYVVLERLGVDHGVAIFAAVAVGLLFRGGSLLFGWTLPAFGHRRAAARQEPSAP